MLDLLQQINSIVSPYFLYILAGMFVLLLICLVFTMIAFVRYKELSGKMEFFMRDTSGDSLEKVLIEVIEDNRNMKILLKNNMNEIAKINDNLVTAYRKIGIVKYNAFPGMAGKMSASIALLNNENNGIIINAIHGTEGSYTYVKEIMNGKSINPLTKEDEEALKIALQMEV